MADTTQDHLPIKQIRDGIVITKNDNYTIVLETTAVNFGLLSINEQVAIIASFAGMLNSLSFSIQIVIRSKRLDITDYLQLLDKAHSEQPNPLLADMMLRYREFIERIVRENEVLDKQFYVVISMSSLELGLGGDPEQNFQKSVTQLTPRRDHIIRQLARIGLKTSQLSSKRLIQLFYDLYNFDPKAPAAGVYSSETGREKEEEIEKGKVATAAGEKEKGVVTATSQEIGQGIGMVQENKITAGNNNISTTTPMPAAISPSPSISTPPPSISTSSSVSTPIAQIAPPLNTVTPRPTRPVPPFVTEELADDYGGRPTS